MKPGKKPAILLASFFIAALLIIFFGYQNFILTSNTKDQENLEEGISGSLTVEEPVVKSSSKTWIDTDLEFSGTEVLEEFSIGIKNEHFIGPTLMDNDISPIKKIITGRLHFTRALALFE